jgi:predicted protein tyrosine phosphatase
MSAPRNAPAPLPAGRIHVCALRLVPEAIRTTGARHLLSIINHHAIPETPVAIPASQHAKISVNDIDRPLAGLIHPNAEHCEAVLKFARAWNGGAPLIVHCLAGISRSTAAAFIALCDLNPDVPELVVARRIRALSPTASPNKLLVAVADDLLGRRGNMVDAVTALGAAQPAPEGVPFALPARLD